MKFYCKIYEKIYVFGKKKYELPFFVDIVLYLIQHTFFFYYTFTVKYFLEVESKML